MTSLHTLSAYELDAPSWRPPLLLTRSGHETAYPELFPGTTALYPQAGSLATHSHVPGGPPVGSASTSATPAKEDDLSETNVKHGYVNKAVIQGETASIYPFIQEKLSKGPTIPIISSLIAAVLERKHLDSTSGGTAVGTADKPIIVPNPGPWTYKAPSRVVYNATRLEAWYSELANPAVPLSRLAKNIPNNPSASSALSSSASAGTGIYGGATATPRGLEKPMDKNLEMLLNRNVPLGRAIWFLRSTGMIEIQQMSKSSLKSSSSSSSQSPANSPAVTYTIEFTNSVIELLKRQLAEIVLPLVHHANLAAGLGARPGMSLKGKARNIMAEEQPREKWLARWTWSIELVEQLYQGGLLEKTRWMNAVLEMLKGCHLVQVEWWLSLLHDTSLDELLAVSWMSKELVRTCLSWLEQAEDPSTVEYATYDENLVISTSTIITVVLQHTWSRNSEAFFQPRFWLEGCGRKERLQSVLPNTDRDRKVWQRLERRACRLLCKEAHPFKEVSTTTEDLYETTSLLLVAGASITNIKDGNATELATTVAHLDGFTSLDSIQELFSSIFTPVDPARFSKLPAISTHMATIGGELSSTLDKQRLQVILDWAITPMRYGEHRKYLAISLVALYLDSNKSRASPLATGESISDTYHDVQNRKSTWQNAYQAWLDSTSLLEQSDREGNIRRKAIELSALLVEADLVGVARLLQVVISRGLASYGPEEDQHIMVQVLAQIPWRKEPLALQAQLRRHFQDQLQQEDGADECIRQIKLKLSSDVFGRNADGGIQTFSSFQLTPESIAEESSAAEGEISAEIRALSPGRRSTLLRDWLLPAVLANPGLSAAPLGHIVRIYKSAGDFSALYTILTRQLSRHAEEDSAEIELVLPIIYSKMLVWTSMGVLPTLSEALYHLYTHVCSRNKPSATLLGELAKLWQAGYLSEVASRELAGGLSSMMQHAPITMHTPAGYIPDIPPFTALHEAEQSAHRYYQELGHSADFSASAVNAIMTAVQNSSHDLQSLVHFHRTLQEQVPEGLEQALAGWLDQLHIADNDGSTRTLKSHASSLTKDVLSFLHALANAGAISCITIVRSLFFPQALSYLDVNNPARGGEVLASILDLLCYVLLDDRVTEQAIGSVASHVCLQRIQLCDDWHMSTCLQLLSLLLRLEGTAITAGHYGLSSITRRLIDGILVAEEVQIASIRNLHHISEYYLQLGADENASTQVADLQILSDILASLKSSPAEALERERSESRHRIRSPSKLVSGLSGRSIQALDANVFLADVKRLEVEVYLKRMELRAESNRDGSFQASDSGTEEGFARRFLENMLASPTGAPELPQGISHLRAFTGDAADQLAQTAFLMTTEEMDPTGTAQAIHERIDGLVAIMRTLLPSMKQIDPSSHGRAYIPAGFVRNWINTVIKLDALDGVLVSKVSLTHMLSMMELLCISMLFGDIWIDCQEELLETLGILCRCMHQYEALVGEPVEVLSDVLSYLVDHMSDRRRSRGFKILAMHASNPDGSPNQHMLALSTSGPDPAIVTMRSGDMDTLSRAKPWELPDVVDLPTEIVREAASLNSSSVDLGTLQAQTREMATAPLLGDAGHSHALLDFAIGRQVNFPFEIPMMQESLWQSDFRRSCNAHLEIPAAHPISVHDESPVITGSRKDSQKPMIDLSESVDTAASGGSKASGSDSAAAKRPASRKRKSVPDITVEEEPKRKKAASKAIKKK